MRIRSAKSAAAGTPRFCIHRSVVVDKDRRSHANGCCSTAHLKKRITLTTIESMSKRRAYWHVKFLRASEHRRQSMDTFQP